MRNTKIRIICFQFSFHPQSSKKVQVTFYQFMHLLFTSEHMNLVRVCNVYMCVGLCVFLCMYSYVYKHRAFCLLYKHHIKHDRGFSRIYRCLGGDMTFTLHLIDSEFTSAQSSTMYPVNKCLLSTFIFLTFSSSPQKPFITTASFIIQWGYSFCLAEQFL